MALDIYIDPTNGKIYFNDNSTESIAIDGSTANILKITGFNSQFSPGSTPTGATDLVLFKDNSGIEALVPGTSGYDLGSDALRWELYATTGNFNNTVTAPLFSGNLSATAITATNFYGTLTGTATTAANLNIVSTNTGTFYPLFTSVSATASGVAVSVDSNLSYDASTDTLTAGKFSGLASGTAATFTNFYGTLTGDVTGTATTAQNLNTVSFTAVSPDQYLLVSSVNGGSGVAVSSGSALSYSPSSYTLNISGLGLSSNKFSSTSTTLNLFNDTVTTIDLFKAGTAISVGSGQGTITLNSSNVLINQGTASTSTFTGALIVNGGVGIGGSIYVSGSSQIDGITVSSGTVYGNLSGTATTATNLQLGSAGTDSPHRLVFTANNNSAGNALSTNSTLVYNPSSDILTVSGMLITSTTKSTSSGTGALIVYGGIGVSDGLYTSPSFQSNISGLAVSNQVISTGTWAGSTITMSYGGTGYASNSKGDILVGTGESWYKLAYSANANDVLTVDVTTASGLKWAAVPPAAASSVAVQATDDAGTRYLTFVNASTGSGLFLSTDTSLSYEASTNTLTTGTFVGNLTGTASTSNNLSIASASSGTTHAILFAPSYSTVGSAVSANGVLVYDISIDRLYSSGISVTASTGSTNQTTGALVVNGGVGVAGTIVANDFYVTANITGPASNGRWRLSTGSTPELTFILPNANQTNAQIRLSNNFNSATSQWGALEFRSDNSISPTTNGIAFGFAERRGTSSGNGVTTLGLFVSDGTNFKLRLSIPGGAAIGNTNIVVFGASTSTSPATTIIRAEDAYGTDIAAQEFRLSAGRSTGTGAVPGITFYVSSPSTTGSVLNTENLIARFTGTGISVLSTTSSTGTNNGAVSIAGGLGLAGNAFIGGTVSITNSTQSTSSTSGALVVDGGAGLGGSLFVSGNINVRSGYELRYFASDNTNYAGFKYTGATQKTYTLPVDTPAAGTANSALVSNDSGVLSWAPMTVAGSAIGYTVFSGNNFELAYYFQNGTGVTGAQYIHNVGTGMSLLYGTNSSSTSTGALVIRGGLGITGNAFIGGTITASTFTGNVSGTAATITNIYGTLTGTATTATNINSTSTTSNTRDHYLLFSPTNGGSGVAVSSGTGLSFNPATTLLGVRKLSVFDTTNSTSSSTGALIVTGGVGVGGTVSVGSRVTVGSNVNSISTTSGALVVSGGLGLGTNAFIGGTVTLSDTTNSTSSSTGSMVLSGGVGVGGTVSIGQRLTVGSTLNSSSTTTGALVNSGGLGMAGNAFIGGTVTLSDTTNSTSSSTGSMVLSGGVGVGGTISVGQRLTVGSTLNSSSTTTGAIVNSGGLGMAGNAFIGGTVTLSDTTNSTSSSTGALIVTGGVGVGQSVSIGGRLQIFNGTNAGFAAFRYTGAGNTVYTLPNNAPVGTAASFLSSDVNGILNWIAPPTGTPGSATPGGSDTQIQFNDGSAFGGATGFTYNKTTYLVSIASTSGHKDFTNYGLRLINNNAAASVGGGGPQTTYSPALELVGQQYYGTVPLGSRFARYMMEVRPSGDAFDLYAGEMLFRASVDQGTPTYETLLKLNYTNGVGIGGSNSTGVNFFRTSSTQSATKTYILPTDYPATGTSVLSSDTTGTLSWVASSGGPGGSGTVNSGTAGSIAVYTGSTAVSAFSDLTIFSGSGVSVNSNINVRNGNELRISASGNGAYTALKSANVSTYTLTLPTAANSSIGASYLTVDTSGNMSYQPAVRKRHHRIQFAAALNPVAGADVAEFEIPFVGGGSGFTSITFKMIRAHARVGTASGTGSSFRIEKYAYDNGNGVGQFSTSSTGSTTNILASPMILQGASTYEVESNSFAGVHITAVSGDKLRLNWLQASNTQYNFSISLYMEENIV